MNMKGVEAALYSAQPPSRKAYLWQVIFVVCASIIYLYCYTDRHHLFIQHSNAVRNLTKHQENALQTSIDRCKQIKARAGPPVDFNKRTRSDRAIEGAGPIVIKNVTLWTGSPEEGDALGEVLYEVDVSIADGLIKSIDKGGSIKVTDHTVVIEGHGRWMTPGIIDVHIHAGLDVLPALRGLDDTNSLKSPVSPYLRSIDGVSNHDWGFVSIASGGITTGLALPGSADSVGGQAYVIKLGRLGKKAVSEGGWTRLVDPPRSLIMPGEGELGRDGLYEENTGMKRLDGSSSFRYMKMACGENDRRVYKETRMDEAKNFRHMFYQARSLMMKQDDFCETLFKNKNQASAEDFNFPDDFLLEAVVDVLRGKTKVNTHCYTLEDFSSFVSHTNEFKFPLAAFHHAHEAYLVPDLLRKVYGGLPAIAMFSLNANYKTEAYFGSPYAAAILSAYNITTLTKSDHPVTDSRRLLSQVAQAHHFGLSAGKSLRGVTSSAANVLGLSHRIGQAKVGYDADLVLWNKYPLKLGAKPVEVIIDGLRQQLVQKGEFVPLEKNDKVTSGVDENLVLTCANYTKDIKRVMKSGPEIVAWESSPFPTAKRRVLGVRLFNVSQVYSIEGNGNDQKITTSKLNSGDSIYLSKGQVVCQGDEKSCPVLYEEEIDLKGGTVMPGLVAFGSPLGVADIVAEPATRDGDAAQESPIAFASDAIRFGGNDLRFAHSLGIRSVVSVPEADVGLIQGVATHFDAGAEELLEIGAIRKEQVALHIAIDHWQASDNSQPTMGQQIAMIRKLLTTAERSLKVAEEVVEEVDLQVWKNIANGTLPLIVQVHQAETISQMIKIKESHPKVKLVLRSADEASFGSIPSRLKKAGIPVLIRPIEWPQIYDARRAVKLGGVQASREDKVNKSSLLGILADAGVKIGFTIDESWQATTLLWDVIAAGREAGLSDEKSFSLATASTAAILELDLGNDIVAFDRSPFEYGARPVAISTPRGIDLMD